MTWDFTLLVLHPAPCQTNTNEEDVPMMFTPLKLRPTEASLRNETQMDLRLLLLLLMPWEQLLQLLMP